jgi:hypothetical protein
MEDIILAVFIGVLSSAIAHLIFESIEYGIKKRVPDCKLQ